MFTPDYWQGRMDQKLQDSFNTNYTPPSPPQVETRTEYIVEEKVVEKVVEKAKPVYVGWNPHIDIKTRLDNQNGKPDAYRIRAFRHLLEKHRKSMVALALESMYPRFDAKESKDERGVEQYTRTVNSLRDIGVNEDNNFADESNRDFYETTYDIHKSRMMHLQKLVSNSKSIAESNLTTTAKQRIIPAL